MRRSRNPSRTKKIQLALKEGCKRFVTAPQPKRNARYCSPEETKLVDARDTSEQPRSKKKKQEADPQSLTKATHQHHQFWKEDVQREGTRTQKVECRGGLESCKTSAKKGGEVFNPRSPGRGRTCSEGKNASHPVSSRRCESTQFSAG